MLTSVDVKFTSIVHLFREIQQIKVCSGLQIYSKQQMLSVELTSRCSCYVFRQYFAVKRVQCPPDSSAILFKQPKQLNLVPRFPRSMVQYDASIGQIIALMMSFHWFNMTVQPLVMVNYACGFTQSEKGKYFE